MNDEQEKTYTLLEVRNAFMQGALWCRRYRVERDIWPTLSELDGESRSRHPSPKKLREVKDCGVRFSAINGMIYGAHDSPSPPHIPLYTDLDNSTRIAWSPTNERIKLWADLLEHPYEGDT